MSKKEKKAVQLPIGTQEWARARRREVPNCPVAGRIILDSELPQQASKKKIIKI
ncbi:hypothetical protein LBW59_25120 [Ralstonia solanacearum]|uniref:Uncharacterized protein n=1 Tax=Ralstonia solanacearum TaxID=305 RepID=A0AAW5ZWQ5_RALSL|nr:hypothetical protein [Ralstonia solanacearum]MDB0509869.1 hypothetical protein [Ralstonia solanacearum]MDB0567374.1 hypothetical protein [Ralstonia solanacearum]MDB0574013.1 hypothetical protein [Ralstonia solanacearum]MDB0577627.1 hypothetical protein [Ralstonia solanacearum]